MMTFKDLKKLVELPSYKEQRVPTVKALEVSGVPVVTEKVLENHGSIKVYQNGYVIYRAHKRVTVFSLRDCVHYKYDAAEGAGHHIEEAEFDDYEWHIRLGFMPSAMICSFISSSSFCPRFCNQYSASVILR